MAKEKTVEELEREVSDALRGERKDKDKRDKDIAGGEFREYEIIPKEKSRGKG